MLSDIATITDGAVAGAGEAVLSAIDVHRPQCGVGILSGIGKGIGHAADPSRWCRVAAAAACAFTFG